MASSKMMDWLAALDTAFFRFLNQSLANPVFDWLMPRLAGHLLFIPALLLAGIWLVCKGGQRGRLLVLFLVLAITLTDGFVCNTIKKAVARPRPGLALADTRCLLGSTGSGSMPSSHPANWFGATSVCFVFYRRSWRLILPVAATVSFSRVYDGVHYPSAVLAGAILGAGSAGAPLLLGDALWGWLGRKWFPIWWREVPSVISPKSKVQSPKCELTNGGRVSRVEGPKQNTQHATRNTQHATMTPDSHWLRLGYLLIAASLLFRLAYIASGTIQLSRSGERRG